MGRSEDRNHPLHVREACLQRLNALSQKLERLRNANAALRRKVEAELQAAHADLHRPQQRRNY
jgi:uncharacterized membrane protein